MRKGIVMDELITQCDLERFADELKEVLLEDIRCSWTREFPTEDLGSIPASRLEVDIIEDYRYLNKNIEASIGINGKILHQQFTASRSIRYSEPYNEFIESIITCMGLYLGYDSTPSDYYHIQSGWTHLIPYIEQQTHEERNCNA